MWTRTRVYRVAINFRQISVFDKMENGDVLFEYVEGERKGSKLLYLKDEQQLFRFKYNYKNEKRYVCYQKKCSASVTVVGNNCKMVNKNHSHGKQEKARNTLKSVSNMKENCKDLNKRKSARQIYNDEMRRSADIRHVPYSKVRRTLERIKSDSFPKSPQNPLDIVQAFGNENVQSNFAFSRHKTTDLFYQNTIIRRDYAFSVFMSPTIKEKLKSSEIAKHYTIDATFLMAPTSGYKYLLVISITYNGHLFPFAYILMNTKNQPAYTHLFQYINENLLKMKPITFHADFDKALRNALHIVFPSVSIKQSWFYYCQALRRDVAKFQTLSEEMNKNEKIKGFFSKFLVLPLLKSEDISEAFLVLKADSSEQLFTIDGRNIFTPFISHFEEYWMNEEKPSNFSVHQQDMKKTNALEEFHTSLARRLPRNGHFFKFLDTIMDVDFEISCKFEILFQPTKKKFKTQQEKIKTLLGKLEEKRITLHEFLHQMSNDVSTIELDDFAEQYEEFSDNVQEIKQEPNEIVDLDSEESSDNVQEVKQELHEVDIDSEEFCDDLSEVKQEHNDDINTNSDCSFTMEPLLYNYAE